MTTSKGLGSGPSRAVSDEPPHTGWVPAATPDPLATRRNGHVGRPLSRVDGPRKVGGQARFAAEVSLDGMTYAALVFSTIARGRLAHVATAAAEASPGVVLVMTHRNAPRMAPMPRYLSSEKAGGGDDLPVMQDAQIHWNGQPIALVLAETQEQADHAASLVLADYDAAAATTAFADAKAAGTRTGIARGQPLALTIGDAEAALATAAHGVDRTYSTPRHSHAAIEPHAATIVWKGDRLIVHDATQALTHAAWSLATIFGIDEANVEIHSPYVGGGFGSKTLWQHQVLGAAAARLSGRPVRIALSREGVFRIVGGRAPTEQRCAIGTDADGRFTAIVHTGTTAMAPHAASPLSFTAATAHLYRTDHLTLDVQVAKVDMVANTTMRAPSEAVGTFPLECAIDELAHAMDVDPVELRIRNEPDRDPTTGKPFSSRNLVAALRRGAERFGWDRRLPAGHRREGEWHVGLGCAVGTYPYYRLPGGIARLTVRRDGTASIAVAGHEMGMGTATVHTQVLADRLGLAPEQVTVEYGRSTLPGMFIAGGAQQTAAISGAIIAAQRALVAALLELAGNDSPLAGAVAEEVEAVAGGLARADDPSRHESYASILERARREELSVSAAAPEPVEWQLLSMHSFSALFCEARVNAVTGEVRIPRFLGTFDCGRILNAKTAASQFRGGIIMGLGLALMEQTTFDERTGRIMNLSLAEYHVPTHLDVPSIEVDWLDIPDPHAPVGARGIGEIGITGVGAAVANAVFNATGKRVRDLPITLDKLL